MIVGAPPDILDAAARLTCSEAVIVSLGIDRARSHRCALDVFL